MNVIPIEYKPFAQTNKINFQAQHRWKGPDMAALIKGYRSKNTGTLNVASLEYYITTFAPTRYRLTEVEADQLEKRIAAIKDDIAAITTDEIDEDENSENPTLWSNILLANCEYPAYTPERFIKDSNKEYLYYSIFTPQSMDIMEKFLKNDAFLKNNILCHNLIDGIMYDFVEVMSPQCGITFKENMDERARKINMIMDTYLNTPQAQKSEIMKQNIGYFMYRAGDAPLSLVKQAVNLISNPGLLNNKDEVDSLLFSMDSKKEFIDLKNQPADIQARLMKAAREIDKFDEIKRHKAYKMLMPIISDMSVDTTNLPVIEKFLDNKELNQSAFWINVLPNMICYINNESLLNDKSNINSIVIFFMDTMDGFLNDTEAQSDEKRITSDMEILLNMIHP